MPNSWVMRVLNILGPVCSACRLAARGHWPYSKRVLEAKASQASSSLLMRSSLLRR
ncbi:hypothetical protein D3C76_1447390 [compost metagenome]